MGAVSEKARLRRSLLERRKKLSRREQKDQEILKMILSFPLYRGAETVLLYLSTPQEVDTYRLLEAALGEGKKVFAPVPSVEGTMAFHQVFRLEDLRPGRFGILEPPGSAPVFSAQAQNPSGKALCFVPGAAFDRRGHRLGYGKGYYDRFLAEAPVISVGLCYEELVLPRLPAEEFDQPVDFLTTEQGCRKMEHSHSDVYMRIYDDRNEKGRGDCSERNTQSEPKGFGSAR